MKYVVTVMTQGGDQFTETFETTDSKAPPGQEVALFANQILAVGYVRHFADGRGVALSHNEIRKVRWEPMG